MEGFSTNERPSWGHNFLVLSDFYVKTSALTCAELPAIRSTCSSAALFILTKGIQRAVVEGSSTNVRSSGGPNFSVLFGISVDFD